MSVNLWGDGLASELKVHFTSYANHWNSDETDNRSMMDAVDFWFTPNILSVPNGNSQEWIVYEKKFTSIDDSRYKNQLSNIILSGGGEQLSNCCGGGHKGIDDLELFEWCPDLMLRQNRDYWLGSEKEEAKIIEAGKTVASNYASGDVILHSPSNIYNGSILQKIYTPSVVYKASQQVNLKEVPLKEVQFF